MGATSSDVVPSGETLVRLLAYLALLAVVLLAVASFTDRGGSRANEGPVGRSANVRFGIGAVLLGAAFVLSVADAETVAVSACYIGGLALLVNGYLQGRIDRRKRRRR